jgi:mRNA interferase RelE/StbE
MAALDLSRQAISFLRDLPPKQFRQVMFKALELTAQPFPNDAIAVKGIEGYYRVDIGEYRIAYTQAPDVVQIVVIEKRNDDAVYRTLKRKLP